MSAIGGGAGLEIEREQVTGLPRVRLARLPTPLEPAPRLAAALGLASLHVKREDQSGYALGGNKLRKLDFIVAEALAAGADTLVTTAGVTSNFCRALAGAAARAGLGAHLHLRYTGPGTPPLAGNLLLDHVLGATVTTTTVTDPWDPRVAAELAEIAAGYRARGRTPHVVQLTGPTAALGVAGWIAGAHELAVDLDAAGLAPEAVVVACGSGLTACGLALGLEILGRPTRVIAVSVQQPAARIREWLDGVAKASAARIGRPLRLPPGRIEVVEAIGAGYAIPSPESIAMVRLAGRTEALLLDPVYTGKAMAGLATLARERRIAGGAVFIHSGGAPGLFAAAAAFEEGR